LIADDRPPPDENSSSTWPSATRVTSVPRRPPGWLDHRLKNDRAPASGWEDRLAEYVHVSAAQHLTGRNLLARKPDF
jgi:hypothetical protein